MFSVNIAIIKLFADSFILSSYFCWVNKVTPMYLSLISFGRNQFIKIDSTYSIVVKLALLTWSTLSIPQKSAKIRNGPVRLFFFFSSYSDTGQRKS